MRGSRSFRVSATRQRQGYRRESDRRSQEGRPRTSDGWSLPHSSTRSACLAQTPQTPHVMKLERVRVADSDSMSRFGVKSLPPALRIRIGPETGCAFRFGVSIRLGTQRPVLPYGYEAMMSGYPARLPRGAWSLHNNNHPEPILPVRHPTPDAGWLSDARISADSGRLVGAGQ